MVKNIMIIMLCIFLTTIEANESNELRDNLLVEKTANSNSKAILLLKTVTYTITIQNNGINPAFDVEVFENLPAELEYVSSSPQGIYRPAREKKCAVVKWKLQSIAVGEKVEIAIILRGITETQITYPSFVVVYDGNKIESTMRLRIVGISAYYVRINDVVNPVKVGDNVTYIVTVGNNGTTSDMDIVLRYYIVPEMKFIRMKASSTTDEQNEDREVIFFTSGIIKPGDKVVYEITCLALKPGSTRALFCAHPSSYFGRPICDLCQTIIIKSE